MWYSIKMKLRVFCLFLLFLLFSSLCLGLDFQDKVVIQGTSVPIKKAAVTLGNITTYTNNQGEFVFKDLIENPTYNIRITAPGYEPLNKDFLLPLAETALFELNLKTIIKADAQTVYADREQEKISYYQIKQKAIKRLSESGLFADTITSLQMLPGVASAGSFDTTMYIRGGSSYEMISGLDNAPIYSPFFFGGKVSIFNPKIVKSVDFYPGGYDASFGQSLSGVIDVKTIDGNYEKFQGFLDMNCTEANFFITNPVVKGKSTIYTSFRRTYYDLMASLLVSQNSDPIAMPYLQSWQTKYSDKLDAQNKLNLSFSYFNDGMNMPFSNNVGTEDMVGYMTYDNKRYIANFELETILSKKVFNRINLIVDKAQGYYEQTESYEMRHTWDDANLFLRDDITLDIAQDHQIDFGGLICKATPAESGTWTQSPNPYYPATVTVNMSYNLNEVYYITGLYIQDSWEINPQHSLKFGLRADNTKLGSYAWKTLIQPRLSYKYKYDSSTTFKAYTGKYSQLRFGGNYSLVSSDTLEWTIANLTSEFAYHYGLGLEKYLAPNILFSTEVFYKDYLDLVINMSDNYPESNIQNQGLGKAGGLELMLQKIDGTDYEGWLTYTYSKTYRKDKDGWHTPDFDVTHMANLFADFKLNEQESLITTIKYSTGKLYTPILGYTTNPVTGTDELIEGDKNSVHMPSYFKLDIWYERPGVELCLPIPFLPVSQDKLWGIFPMWKFKGATRLGLFNALASKNAVSVYWNDSDKEQKFIYDLPMIPVIGYRIDF